MATKEFPKPTEDHIAQLAEYLMAHAEVVESERTPGRFYVTLPKDARTPEIGGIAGRLDFAWIGLSDAGAARERRATRLASDVDNATPEEAQALLARLTAKLGQ